MDLFTPGAVTGEDTAWGRAQHFFSLSTGCALPWNKESSCLRSFKSAYLLSRIFIEEECHEIDDPSRSDPRTESVE